MAESISTLRVNSDRMLDMFNKLALIGATGDGGVSRVTFSGAHLAARKWFREQIERSGLDFSMDGAGNYSATLTCDCSNAQTLLLGSHLDSVPNGGRFDGALGVIAALEVLRTVKENGIMLKVNLEAIDFTDEEGTLVGLLGSAALAGHLHLDGLKNPRGGRENLEAGMARAGLTDESMLAAARPKGSLAGYLELHIEQGNRLERNGINVGVVSAIVGIRSYRLSFIGRADHAGSTLMTDRADASLGASAFTLAAREIVMKDFPNCVVNVGKMEFTPGAFNIVPALVNVALEFRAPSDEEFDQVGSALLVCAEMEAQRFGLALKKEFLGSHSPSLASEKIKTAFVDACNGLGLTHIPLISGAGHDGQSLVDMCPIGMIFVPSVDGASHAPREFTKWEDCVNGANVLLQAVIKLGTE
ncbi:MAG: Zn-dependent hydrolase [Anaerolineales bacterium]|nr:Zn-dependent hydrolase [Anaerolineales bacterium]